MPSQAFVRTVQALVVLGSIAAGLFAAVAVFVGLHSPLPFPALPALAVSAATVLGVVVLLAPLTRRPSHRLPAEAAGLAALIAVMTVMVSFTAYQMAAYVSLPVDLLSFAESPFVNDILKFRLGLPIYTPPADNDSYPYPPGTQLLTYAISLALGHGDSIPFFRGVEFSYVVLAAVVATSVCDLLARRLLSPAEYSLRPLWLPVWFLILFLATTDPRFNPYTPSLHNDGLALLVSVTAYWLIVKHSLEPRPWLLAGMAVLPAVGVMVKQNQLLWAGVFFLYLLGSGKASRRQALLYAVACALVVGLTLGTCYLLWGEPYRWWVFNALGQKQVFLPRSIMNLFSAGAYAALGLAAGWVLVLRGGSRASAVIWLCWLLVFGIQAYTTGIGFQVNHLGPGIVLAIGWSLVALAKVWPLVTAAPAWWRSRVQEAMAVAAVVLLIGGLGYLREPLNPIPADFYRYVAEIEAEFSGLPADKVLLDYGTWIYFRENVVMKDRSAPVSLHVGINQELDHDKLKETIARIEARTYDKILARQLDTGDTAYDFQNRGSGVKAAILANYRVVRRIAPVQGIRQWWPEHLVQEILVLVPKDASNASTGGRRAGPELDGSSTALDLPESTEISMLRQP